MDDSQAAAQAGEHDRSTVGELRDVTGLRHLVLQGEQDRKILAYEIHDGVLQDLVGAKMMIESLIGDLEVGEPVEAGELERVRDLLGKAVAEGRRLLRQLRPLVIDDRDFATAISYLIQEFAAHDAFQVNYQQRGNLPPLDDVARNALFRILQESLTNAQRHSGVDRALVQIETHDQQLVVTIQDEGVGFDRNQVPRDRWGLLSIEDRARIAGGNATIRSTPGQGTVIHVRLPIRHGC